MNNAAVESADESSFRQMLAEEDRAAMIALRHMASFPPFRDLPETQPERWLADFVRLAETSAVSRTDMVEMLKRDVSRYAMHYRAGALQDPALAGVRVAVLVHVRMVVGKDALSEMRGMWTAISNGRWDDAERELMMSNWPAYATSMDERLRFFELARMMRTGSLPEGWE